MSTRKRRTLEERRAAAQAEVEALEAKLKLKADLQTKPELKLVQALLRAFNALDKGVKGEARKDELVQWALERRTELIGKWVAAGRVVPGTRNRALGTGSGKIVPHPKKKPSRKKKRTLKDV